MLNTKKDTVAPLKIIEQYDCFKKAVYNKDFYQAELCLQEMKLYQGGIALANELQAELNPLLLNQTVNLPLVNEQTLLKEKHYQLLQNNTSELLAQEILAHIEAFAGFLKDKYYDLAKDEIAIIRELGDNDCADNLANKLNKAQQLINKKTSNTTNIVPSLIKINEKNQLENFNFNYNDFITEFNTLIEKDRLIKAKNILTLAPINNEEKAVLQQKITDKNQVLDEQKQQAKINQFIFDLDQTLAKNDFQEAKKILTQIKKSGFKDLLTEGENKLQIAINKEHENLEKQLFSAIINNIKNQHIKLAQNNLKDLKKIGNKIDKAEKILLINILEIYINIFTDESEQLLKKDICLQEKDLNKVKEFIISNQFNYNFSDLNQMCEHFLVLKRLKKKQKIEQLKNLIQIKSPDLTNKIGQFDFTQINVDDLNELLAMENQNNSNTINLSTEAVKKQEINFQKITTALNLALENNNLIKAYNILLASDSTLTESQMSYLKSLWSNKDNNLVKNIETEIKNIKYLLNEKNMIELEDRIKKIMEIGLELFFISENNNYIKDIFEILQTLLTNSLLKNFISVPELHDLNNSLIAILSLKKIKILITKINLTT